MEQPRWQPTTHDNYEELIGRDVYTNDGERLGLVDGIIHPEDPELEQANLGHFIVVRPDFLNSPLGTEVTYIPETNVAAANPDSVELNVAKRQLRDQDWTHLPVDINAQSVQLPEEIPPAPEGNWYEISNRIKE